MTGIGVAGGAATIVNAFATGRGAAFGLGYVVRARVRPARAWSVRSGGRRLRPPQDALALITARTMQRRLGTRGPLAISIDSQIPPAKGLKSSSAVGVAVARAVAAEAQATLSLQALLEVVADAGIASGTSLTGAFDDAAACALGGVVLTDNDRRRIVQRSHLPPGLVALVSTPLRSLATGSLRRAAFRPLASLVDEAWAKARRGAIAQAMLANTLAYAPALGHLPRFTLEALKAGAWAAGLSGKGPAEVALVRAATSRRFRHLGGRLVPVGGAAS